MKSSLKAQFGPRVQIQVVEKISGSNAAFFLSVEKGKFTRAVSAAQFLMRCGVPISKGKAAVEKLLETGSTALEFPSAPDDLPARLAEFGITAMRRQAGAVDVAAIRGKLGLTQEEFAAAYGLTAATVKNWEQHRSEPDAAARAFLRVIEQHPEIAEEAVTA